MLLIFCLFLSISFYPQFTTNSSPASVASATSCKSDFSGFLSTVTSSYFVEHINRPSQSLDPSFKEFLNSDHDIDHDNPIYPGRILSFIDEDEDDDDEDEDDKDDVEDETKIIDNSTQRSNSNALKRLRSAIAGTVETEENHNVYVSSSSNSLSQKKRRCFSGLARDHDLELINNTTLPAKIGLETDLINHPINRDDSVV